ncbi:hypothetical protein [Ferrimonas pelagia]|uniref:Uncharacterized protein n=1 Tax=Ferrimonas pelagia TaxID=1177826 RepID=A0ABP9F264_9GAMM
MNGQRILTQAQTVTSLPSGIIRDHDSFLRISSVAANDEVYLTGKNGQCWVVRGNRAIPVKTSKNSIFVVCRRHLEAK